MKIQEKFVAELFCVLRHCQRVFQIVRQVAADRLDENAQANPVVAVVFEKLQTGRGVRAVLENFSAILGLFQKRQVRPEGKFRSVRRKAPTTKHQAPEKHQAPNTQLPSRSIWSLEVGISLELGCWSLEKFQPPSSKY